MDKVMCESFIHDSPGATGERMKRSFCLNGTTYFFGLNVVGNMWDHFSSKQKSSHFNAEMLNISYLIRVYSLKTQQNIPE